MTTNIKPVMPVRRRQGLLDRFVGEVAVAVQVLSGAATASRTYPPGRQNEPGEEIMPATEQSHAAGLMRVNHVGEVCAQALYRGQALACKRDETRALLRAAAHEEVDHLVWCSQRLEELSSRPSLLNPIWYLGSFVLGALASQTGERYNLGFMAETERQVEAHLAHHLKTLPAQDARSRQVVVQMRDDEIRHRKTAQQHGAIPLPAPIPAVMKFVSKVMTKSAYRI